MIQEATTDDRLITIDPRDLSDATLAALVAGLAAEIPSMIAAPNDDPRSHRLLAAGMGLSGALRRRQETAVADGELGGGTADGA